MYDYNPHPINTKKLDARMKRREEWAMQDAAWYEPNWLPTKKRDQQFHVVEQATQNLDKNKK